MPDTEGLTTKIYTSMGVDPKVITEQMHDEAFDILEDKVRSMWTGLIEKWIPYREKFENIQERQRVMEQFKIEAAEDLNIVGLENNMNFYRNLRHSRVENPQKLRKFIRQQLQDNPEYKKKCLLEAKAHKDVKSIPELLQKDAAIQSATYDMSKPPPPWVDDVPKFHSLEVEKVYDTDIIRDDWRPFRSIQNNTRKIIFTLDDNSVFIDIRGDNRLIFLEWGDDLEGLVHRDYIFKQTNQFREQNVLKVNKIKDELEKAKLIFK